MSAAAGSSFYKYRLAVVNISRQPPLTASCTDVTDLCVNTLTGQRYHARLASAVLAVVTTKHERFA